MTRLRRKVYALLGRWQHDDYVSPFVCGVIGHEPDDEGACEFCGRGVKGWTA